MADKHIFLRVLFFQEPDAPHVWVAQALEHDIAAYGADVPAATRALIKTLAGYVTVAERIQKEPFAGMRPAPDEFFSIWQQLAVVQPPAVQPLTGIPGFMIPAVSHDTVPSTY